MTTSVPLGNRLHHQLNNARMNTHKKVPSGYSEWPSFGRYLADYAEAFGGWRRMLRCLLLPSVDFCREEGRLYEIVIVSPYLASRRLNGIFWAELHFGDRDATGARWRFWTQVEEFLA